MEKPVSKNLKVSFAKVTPKGILFLGIRFSCIRAIREQWFEKAMIEKGWKIKVYYYEDNASHIFILNPEEETLDVCNSIKTSDFQGSKLERYFQSIQLLKALRKQSKHRITKRIKENWREENIESIEQ
ncbi:hypothetical protein [Paenibacillus alginolyticus]|nr:hypothetical protein [Paenibacillus alginolyticus]MEC0143340.1 hypothetical protein [Paenibacillus alginolyticus]